jgi:hypothetical protein
VEVAFDLPSLRIGRLDDPGAGRADILQLIPDLGGQPLGIDREPGRGTDGLDEARILLVDRPVVDDDGEGSPSRSIRLRLGLRPPV